MTWALQNGGRLHNGRSETSRKFRNKMGNIRKTKLMNLKQRARTGILYTCIHAQMNLKELSTLVKDEKSDMLGEFHNILNRCKNCFIQVLNVHEVNNIREI
jgi:hypothetical protein